jgi:phytol kinase
MTLLESTTALWLQLTIVALWVGFVLVIASLVNKFINSDAELLRKIVHIGTGNVILFAWWLDAPAIVGIVASIIASAVTLLSYIFPILPGINSVGRKSLGTFFYSVSIGILIAWFWYIQQPQYAALGILIMCWGDGLAALVGQRFGKHKYQLFGLKKSWEGSLTMAVVAFLLSFVILIGFQSNILVICLVSFVVALFSAILEAFSPLGIDNLTVPIGSAALAFLLMQIICSQGLKVPV